MATRLFDDEVVQITEFKRHAKDYAERARRRPLTIAQGSVADLTLISRSTISDQLRELEHLARGLELFEHRYLDTPLRTLGWAGNLSHDERDELLREFIEAVRAAMVTNTARGWDEVDVVLEDWKATAESVDNDELLASLQRRPLDA